jgi:hypothetical protein
LKEEAPALQGNMTLGPTLEPTTGLISQLLFHLVGENDARKYIVSFDQLVAWVDNSLDIYKVVTTDKPSRLGLVAKLSIDDVPCGVSGTE